LVTLGEVRIGVGQDADAAAQVDADPAQRRQRLQQQGRAGIQAVPAEHARLGPQAVAVQPARRALGDGGVQAVR
jgi:muconolactone delta-isomerase